MATVIRHQQGISLIELLVSISLSGLVFLLLLPSLRTHLSIFSKHIKQAETYSRLEIAKITLENASKKAETFFGLETILIHRTNEISNFHGILAKENSEAVSFLHLDTRNSMAVLQKNLSGSGKADLVGCSTRIINSSLPKTWLGLSLDGAVLLTGTVRHLHSASYQCSGNLFRTKLESHANFAFNQWFIKAKVSQNLKDFELLTSRLKLLIPIKESFSVLLDKQGTLRWLSLLSRDNQPLVNGISKLSAQRLGSSINFEIISEDKDSLVRQSVFSSYNKLRIYDVLL